MKPFAIYFPQFYPIPINDSAWGNGFTDWSLVANANMRAWWERRAPERGFYDGSSTAVHLAQMEEARSAGLGGFGVYHYWFFTYQELDAFERTLLRRPAEPAMPWFLIWASEGWSRRWMGDPTTLVHLSTQPSSSDIERHCDHLAECFDHAQYFRIRGRPLFAWYNLGHFSRPEQIVNQYRKCWAARGFDVHVAQFVSKPFDARYGPLVDSNYLFEPRLYFSFLRSGRSAGAKTALDSVTRALGERFVSRLLVWMDRMAARGKTYPAAGFLRYMSSPERQALIGGQTGPVQDVLTPGWNNAPRYGAKFTALENLTAEAFAELVASANHGAELPLLINAWNEWSEGAAIEPCAYLGRRYLDAVQGANIDRAPARPPPTSADPSIRAANTV